MIHSAVIGVIGGVIGILIGVSFGAKIRTEIKTGFDNLAKTVETELKALAVAIKSKV
jgi:uncharacterized membrane protein